MVHSRKAECRRTPHVGTVWGTSTGMVASVSVSSFLEPHGQTSPGTLCLDFFSGAGIFPAASLAAVAESASERALNTKIVIMLGLSTSRDRELTTLLDSPSHC